MVETVFSANNREEVVVLPYTPTGLVFSEPQNNSTFDGLSRGRGLIGAMQPRTASFSARFFKHQPKWCHPLCFVYPIQYVEFFRKWREKLVPLRLVVSTPEREIINMAVLIDSFEWEMLRNEDIACSITLREYTFIN